VVLPGEAAPTNTSLVVSIVGTDRPGIVNSLAERAQRFGANWAASRMTRLAGEFAGMVHFEVPRENAQALTTSLQGLASSGLQVVIAGSEGAALPASLRLVELELVGEDQLGIVSKLTKVLAERAISIESIHTDIVRSSPAGPKTFKVKAQLRVPAAMSVEALQRDVGALASDMMLDIALGEGQDSGL
jgi:glycine cleavage system regulatory protein